MLQKAVFPLVFTFPKAGEYLVGLDFATSEEAYSKRLTLNVAGEPKMGEPKIDFSTRKTFGEYQVTLTASPETLQAGREATLRYVVEKADVEKGWMFPTWREHETYGYLHELQHFLECIIKGEMPRETFEDGYLVNRIMDTAYEASQQKMIQTLSTLFGGSLTIRHGEIFFQMKALPTLLYSQK
jgi:hypothetical protein